MLGFTLPKNFNHPYESRSVTEFWRKWHITLGAWFKQYVYIPLGGNRSGKPKTIRNLFIVWFLVGFWHGASWNFIIWGLMIFVFQGIEKLAILKWLNKENLFAKIVSHIYLWFYILLSWTVFAITDLKELSIYYAKLFPFYKVGTVINQLDFAAYIKDYSLLLVFCFIFCTSFPIKFFAKLKERLVGKYIFVTAGIGIFWYAVYFLSMGINNPFLYFRF